ncbi:hypothetical protein PF008_g24695 [Phytophthora fragariae]|uniref:Nucleoside diphosphate kinase-like domain-containing protein n=1 Tax=Phytophthora fragariae TaxID=53985 RepID=A0A6G0QN33_9STRA|nr:hypothetical protein PF008_g24695 [Phytophthora fragariae]
MGGEAFVVVLLKPEIATGFFKFSTSDGPDDGDDPQSAAPSSIPGVSAVEAAFLLPTGHIIPSVVARIKDKGFDIVQRRTIQLTRAEARHLFSFELHHRYSDDEQTFAAFLAAITSGPSLALLLKLPEALALGDANAAIKKWVELAGDWDPVAARKKALAASIPHDQWPLRALCGLNTVQNGISSSPHACCSRRERFFLFPPPSPQLERATIVLLPSFQSNFPDGKEILLSTIGKEARAIVVENRQGCTLSGDEAIALCGLPCDVREGPVHQVCDSVIQRAEEVVGDKGVEVLVIEGLDLSYTLRSVLGPANVEMARLYFPDSVRGQVPSKLPTVELPEGLYPNETADDDDLGFESGLFLSFDSKLSIGSEVSVGGFQRGTPIEFTLGLIKPNAACNPEVVAEIMHIISLFGFTVERQRRLLLSREQAGAFYAEHRGKPFFETLLGFMTSGEIVALHLSRSHAIKAWRALMGPTNSIKARETHPWTLRARFGVDGTRNATHGSDASTSAARELCFFFGSAVSVSSAASKLPDVAPLTAQTMAQRPMVLSGMAESSVEKVLTQGLKELVGKKLTDPLEACRWLGEWLVTYRSRGLEEGLEVRDGPQPASANKLLSNAKHDVKEGTSLKARKVVAVTLDTAINNAVRSAVFDILHGRLKDARYELVDVASELKKCTALDMAVSSLIKTLKERGRRRCVLFGCEEFTPSSVFYREFMTQAPVDWQITYFVHLELSGNNSSCLKRSSSFGIPNVHFTLPSTSASNPQGIRKSGALHGLFQTVFDPNVVLVADPKKLVSVDVWTEVVKSFGFHLLTFDSFIAMMKTSSDDSDETRMMLQLVRSGSTLPPTLLLTLLRRVLLGSQPGTNTLTQKFVLLGFPWSDIQAAELEQAIGRPQSVLVVENADDRLNTKSKSTIPEFPAWINAFRKRGLVQRVWIDSEVGVDCAAVSFALHGALAPVIGCFLGDEQLRSVQAVAKSQGFIWVECALSGASTVQKLSELLLRGHAGREKFLLYGYPQTAAQAADLIKLVGSPQFVIYDSSSASPVAQELVAVLDAHPKIMQLDLASATTAQASAKLRSTFFRKQIVAVTGSVGPLDLRQLRHVVAPLGYDVIDFQQNDHNDEYELIHELERRVQAVRNPRCLVVGAPETPSFYHALEAHIGRAMLKIFILQHVQARVQSPDAMDDGDSDDSDGEQGPVQVDENGSDSEENSLPMRGAVKWRKVMKALSPQLSQLLQTFASSSTSSISLEVLGFLENTPYGSFRVAQDLVSRLRPRLFGIVGHPFSFYQTAARGFCRRHLVGFVDLRRVSSSSQALEILETVIAASSHNVYCLDGFPCSDEAAPSKSSSSPPRYVAQKVWELDRRLGAFTTLVHFTTALEVLEERTPEHVTRRMLDVAQDDLELASADLLSWFSTGKNRRHTVNEVTCDRTLEDAQEELESVLQRAVLRPTRPTIG